MGENFDGTIGPLIFPFHVGKLSEMAAVSLTACLIHHKIAEEFRNGKSKFKVNEVDLICKLVPKTVKEMVSGLACTMNDSIKKWRNYVSACAFFESRNPNPILKFFNDLVWLPDGSISRGQTARKMMSNDELSAVEKFRIASTFCLGEQVNQIWWKMEIVEREKIVEEVSDTDQQQHWLPGYWVGKLTKAKNQIVEMDLFKKLILKKSYCRNWLAVEYLWNRLSSEQRIPMAYDLIRSIPNYTYHLLPKLSGHELDKIMDLFNVEIITSLFENPKHLPYALLAWKRMMNLVDDDTLWSILCRINRILPFQCEKELYYNVVWEIWQCAPDGMKNKVVEEPYLIIAEPINSHPIPYNYRLIVDVLSRTDFQYRNNFWLANWEHLIYDLPANQSSIEQIMKLCFSNDQEMVTFKRTVMISYLLASYYCLRLVHRGNFNEAQIYLDFCLPDRQMVVDLKKQLLMETLQNSAFEKTASCWMFFQKIPDFQQFIDGVFTTEELVDFKHVLPYLPRNLAKAGQKIPGI